MKQIKPYSLFLVPDYFLGRCRRTYSPLLIIIILRQHDKKGVNKPSVIVYLRKHNLACAERCQSAADTIRTGA